MLRYVCDRFELNNEQRYWLAFLYALCYCGPTVFYIYNELPDYENLDSGRMTRWWYGGGREASIFQTDARWRRSRNQVVDAIESYRRWVGKKTQEEHFAQIATGDTPEKRYNQVYRQAKGLYTLGQFSLFNYIESLHTITPLDLCPTDLNLDDSWSPRDGLLYAYGLDHHIRDAAVPIPPEAKADVSRIWSDLRSQLAILENPPSVWAIETILCAFRKYQRTLEGKAGALGKRWVGYYLDRQADEIAQMQARVQHGVSWNVLWQYRKETYLSSVLTENNDGMWSARGRPKWQAAQLNRTKEMLA